MSFKSVLIGLALLVLSGCHVYITPHEELESWDHPIVGYWKSNCTISMRTTYDFRANGTMTMGLESYDSLNCAGFPRSISYFEGDYTIGDAYSNLTEELDIHLTVSGSHSDLYTVVQINGDTLYTATAKPNRWERPLDVDPNNYMTRGY